MIDESAESRTGDSIDNCTINRVIVNLKSLIVNHFLLIQWHWLVTRNQNPVILNQNPVVGESKSKLENKIESSSDKDKNQPLTNRDISSNKEKSDEINVLTDVIDDETTDFEADEDIVVAEFDNKTKRKEEPALVAEGLGEKAKEEKKIITEEIVIEEDESELAEEIAYDKVTKGNERKLDNNVNRAKLSSNKKTRTKDYLDSYQKQGIDAYNDGNYPEATVALNNSVKYEGKEEKTLFYLGQTYSAQGDSKKALLNFNKLLKNKDSQYQNEAMWEKAQLLIQMEKRKSAISVLNDLVKVNSPYKIEAQQKLDSLLVNWDLCSFCNF